MDPVFEPLPPSAIQYQKDHANGKAMHNLSIKRESAEASARMSGIVPFSVVNFNPVPIVPPPGLLDDLSVQAIGSPLGKDRSVVWGGKTRVGKILVLENLKGHAVITDARSEGDPSAPDVTYDWRVIPPIQQAKAFDDSYNRTREQRSMGGVLVFKGNAATLDDPKELIEVPVATRLKDGNLQYHTKIVPLKERLKEIFDLQKVFCLAQCELAQQWSEDEQFKKSITPAHRAWGQFAIDMGWADQGRLAWLIPSDPDAACVKCGSMRTSGTALFCKCGRPYDPFKAFMAGEPVETNYLATLPAEQLKEVKAEMARREKLFAKEEPKK